MKKTRGGAEQFFYFFYLPLHPGRNPAFLLPTVKRVGDGKERPSYFN